MPHAPDSWYDPVIGDVARGLMPCSIDNPMSFLSRLFGRSPQPRAPFVEYPDGALKSARDALQRGLQVYRAEGAGRPAVISWQGQGGRVDSYHVMDLFLTGDVVSFREASIDLERACAREGFAFGPLRQPVATDLGIASLSEQDAAALIEALLVKHAGMKPFADSGDFCVAFEYTG